MERPNNPTETDIRTRLKDIAANPSQCSPEHAQYWLDQVARVYPDPEDQRLFALAMVTGWTIEELKNGAIWQDRLAQLKPAPQNARVTCELKAAESRD